MNLTSTSLDSMSTVIYLTPRSRDLTSPALYFIPIGYSAGLIICSAKLSTYKSGFDIVVLGLRSVALDYISSMLDFTSTVLDLSSPALDFAFEAVGCKYSAGLCIPSIGL